MKVTVMMCLNKSILELYQTYKNLQEKVQAGLSIQSLIIPLVFQRLAGNSYIKLPKELDHPRKGLINNTQNTDDDDDDDDDDDNKCFKLCLVRYLNSFNHDPERITKTDKEIEKKLNFKNIKFSVKIRDIQKIEKKNSIGINAFGYGNKQ